MYKKFLILFILFFTLVGCSNKDNIIDNNHTLIMELESFYSMVQYNINEVDESNRYTFDYDREDVGKYKVNMYLYYSPTCPHCHAELNWLNDIKSKYSYLNIITKDASENMNEYEDIVEKMEINDYHVPLTIIGNTFYIGFAESKEDDIIKIFEYYSTFDNCDVVDSIINNKDIKECKQINKK